MVIDQNVQWCAVWDSEKKDFLGIITIRDLLEMIVYFVDSLKDSFTREESKTMSEVPFMGYFLERYMMIPPSALTSESSLTRGRGSRVMRQADSGHNLDAFSPDLSMLDRILD